MARRDLRLMTGGDFAAAVDELGWSNAWLARYVGCDERLVRKWITGELRVPPAIAAWIHTRLLYHRAQPPPPLPKRTVSR
jgi:hypothetical protein